MSHSCCHHHTPKNYDKYFLIGIILNFVYVLIQTFYGFYFNSLAVLADAAHNFNDVLFLIFAWGSIWISSKGISEIKTFGYKKMTIIAPIISSIALIVSMFFVAIEAFNRFGQPQMLNGYGIAIVSAIGFFINFWTGLFFSNDGHDLNINSISVHMFADAALSIGVVISGMIIYVTGWCYIDPIISLIIIIVILYANYGILRDSINLIFDGVPKEIKYKEVETYFKSHDFVKEIHNLHIWALSSNEYALTVHLIITNKNYNLMVPKMTKEIKKFFKIENVTIQMSILNCCKKENKGG